jgi:hypothetical protein
VAVGKDLAASASAALAKATIEAKFVVAMRNRRSVLGARAAILDACRRPRFAEAALFSKPIGDGRVEGFSIRFAEAALNSWGNVDTTAVTAWEDEEQRLVRIGVVDLETNVSYSDEVLLQKTVERSTVKNGQEVLGERINSKGKRVFVVRATEDELQIKLGAAKSKVIRNNGLRLIPADIKEEAMELIRSTSATGGGDRAADGKRLADAFANIGISVEQLEAYVGHSLSNLTPAELVDLRKVYASVRDGEATWSEFTKQADDVPMDSKAPAKDAGPAAPAPDKPKEEKAPEGEPSGGPILTAAQNRMDAWLSVEGIAWDDFTAWLASTNRAKDAKDWVSVAEMPDELIERLWEASHDDAGYKKNLGRCAQLYGKKR